jgi:parallel beta-helix repeat protein
VFLGGRGATLTGNTIISNTGRGVNVWHGRDVTLTGNTISYNQGTGVQIVGDNVLFSGNTVSHNSSDWAGGISVGGGSVTISGNSISFNSVTQAGGGVLIGGDWDGDVTLSGNLIANNSAGGTGGGLFRDTNHDFTIKLIGNTITNNSAEDGGGLALGDRAELINNLIVDNQATHCCGSGVQIGASASVRLVHNTIARNTGGGGIGVALLDRNTVSMTNTILVGHLVGIRVDSGSTATLNSTLWGNDLDWEAGGTLARSNDYYGDPDFVDPNNGDYHIGGNSAALDVGVDADVKTDVDFHPRPYQAPDLGADEYWPPGTLTIIYMPLVLR